MSHGVPFGPAALAPSEQHWHLALSPRTCLRTAERHLIYLTIQGEAHANRYWPVCMCVHAARGGSRLQEGEARAGSTSVTSRSQSHTFISCEDALRHLNLSDSGPLKVFFFKPRLKGVCSFFVLFFSFLSPQTRLSVHLNLCESGHRTFF